MARPVTRGRTVARCGASSRPFRTLTLSPRTEALLSKMSLDLGIARGRIVDMAIEAIGVCEQCRGSGTSDGPLGRDTEVCSWCRGSKIVPCA